MARKFGSLLFYSAANLNLPTALTGGATAGNWNLARNALGDVSLNNNVGAVAVQFWCDLADYKRPFITFQYPGISAVQPTSTEFQNIFGTAAGGPSNPFSGGATTPQFEVPPLPWGVAIIDIFACYSVQTAALTSCTLGLNRATFTENVAFTNTAVIAATATALTTTASATACHVAVVPATNPVVFEINNNSNISVELNMTPAATSAVRVYGVGCHAAVCFD